AYTFMKTQEKYTLPVWLASFATPSGVDVGAQMAASLIFSVPVIVFFLIIQHGLTFGSMQGAIK
nr:carbohydrate ABC transporter permease [Gardnerella vaginalis]